MTEECGLKLYYKGESAAVVGNNFIKALFVDKRESTPMALRKELVEKQKNRYEDEFGNKHGVWSR